MQCTYIDHPTNTLTLHRAVHFTRVFVHASSTFVFTHSFATHNTDDTSTRSFLFDKTGQSRKQKFEYNVCNSVPSNLIFVSESVICWPKGK